jgi:hypothetical protein
MVLAFASWILALENQQETDPKLAAILSFPSLLGIIKARLGNIVYNKNYLLPVFYILKPPKSVIKICIKQSGLKFSICSCACFPKF